MATTPVFLPEKSHVYIPLGGTKKGKIRTYLNLFITFFISGLWHGAAWNFVFWGAYHAVVQIIERILNIKKYITTKYHRFAWLIATQILVFTGWIFFRSQSLSEALYIMGKICSLSSETAKFTISRSLGIILLFIVMETFLVKKADQFLLKRFKVFRYIEPFLIGFFIIMIVLLRVDEHGFIYFQF